jgi:hypothetical protein
VIDNKVIAGKCAHPGSNTTFGSERISVLYRMSTTTLAKSGWAYSIFFGSSRTHQ